MGPIQLSHAVEQAVDAFAVAGPDGAIRYVNPSFEALTGYAAAECLGQPMDLFRHEEQGAAAHSELCDAITSGRVWKDRLIWKGKGKNPLTIEAVASPLHDAAGAPIGALIVARDETGEAALETQLLHGLKMEAVGKLASGIAHEINTPTQYVGDNVRFFKETFGGILELLRRYERLATAARAGAPCGEQLQEIDEATARLDLEFVLDEIPIAIEQSLEGIGRVTEIVRAMKEFAHPGLEEMTSVDINRAVRNTISVARNEWKYVAEVITEFDPELPWVTCVPGAINQVLLNLFVNAAHAIEAVPGRSEKGRITVCTRRDGDWAEIRIGDTGAGIPDEVRGRIFDPFFTTKEPGKGTGQGLASAHFIVVKKHRGTITVETELGKGATFIIRLPMRGDTKKAAE